MRDVIASFECLLTLEPDQRFLTDSKRLKILLFDHKKYIRFRFYFDRVFVARLFASKFLTK